MELSSIKRYAEHNYNLLYSDNPNKVSKGVDISFDYEGQAISNPWIDPSARFELTTDKAVETYGLVNILWFCNVANIYIKENSLSREPERTYVRNLLDMAILAYKHSSAPTEAVKSLVDAFGKHNAELCVATLVNAVSLSDGRISDTVRLWAQCTEALTHPEIWAMHIYGVDSHIHSAHVNQLGNAMRRYK